MKKKRMKIELDMAKCKAAMMELEYKIMEREEEIERIREHIKLQEERKLELETELEGLK